MEHSEIWISGRPRRCEFGRGQVQAPHRRQPLGSSRTGIEQHSISFRFTHSKVAGFNDQAYDGIESSDVNTKQLWSVHGSHRFAIARRRIDRWTYASKFPTSDHQYLDSSTRMGGEGVSETGCDHRPCGGIQSHNERTWADALGGLRDAEGLTEQARAIRVRYFSSAQQILQCSKGCMSALRILKRTTCTPQSMPAVKEALERMQSSVGREFRSKNISPYGDGSLMIGVCSIGGMPSA